MHWKIGRAPDNCHAIVCVGTMDSLALFMVDWDLEAKLAQAASARIAGPVSETDEEGSGMAVQACVQPPPPPPPSPRGPPVKHLCFSQWRRFFACKTLGCHKQMTKHAGSDEQVRCHATSGQCC